MTPPQCRIAYDATIYVGGVITRIRVNTYGTEFTGAQAALEKVVTRALECQDGPKGIDAG